MPKEGNNHISFYIKRLSIKLLRLLLDVLILIKNLISKPIQLVANTIGVFVYKILQPIVLLLYRLYLIPKKQISKLYQNHTNRYLQIFSHRYIVHSVIVIIALLTVTSNIEASEINTADFGKNTLIKNLIQPEEEMIVEKGLLRETTIVTSYIEASDPALVAEGSSGQPINEKSEITALDSITTTQGDSVLLKPTISPETTKLQEELNGKRQDIVEYVVKDGDTVSEIAAKYGLKVTTVLWANNLGPRDYIRPGDKLKILATDGVAHTVKKGDNLSKIAKKYDVDIEKIKEYNKLTDTSIIKPGQTLIIPGAKISTYAAPRRQSTFSRIKDIFIPPKAIVPTGVQMIWPTTGRTITQYFTWRHHALDIDGTYSSPIYASDSGKVVRVKGGWSGGYGLHIVIDHGNGIKTLYAHLSKVYVNVGQYVEKGDTIAMMGTTGRSTGTHLHFEVRSGGRAVNPLNYVQ